MKNTLGAQALLVSLAITTLTGCSSMTDAKDSDELPSAGTSTSLSAADQAEKVSSEIYDLIGIKGKASDTGPGVSECSGKDPDKYFQIFHPWSFTPASADPARWCDGRAQGETIQARLESNGLRTWHQQEKEHQSHGR
ncbi:hypothetical protein RB201_14075 [Streptomyces sp. S1A(2023)]